MNKWTKWVIAGCVVMYILIDPVGAGHLFRGFFTLLGAIPVFFKALAGK